jgi:hypothetical protein
VAFVGLFSLKILEYLMDRHHSAADVHTNNHGVKHNDMQHDVDTAKLAWECWKSDDPQKVDWAIAEKARIQKTDPKAWNQAMRELDAAAQAPLPELAIEPAPPIAPVPDSDLSLDSSPVGRAEAAPPLIPADARGVNVHAGYAPESQFAPAPPNSPAYDAAYNQPPARFYGLDLNVIKVGVTDRGSLDLGVNVGLARAEVQAGLENRVDGEFMPIGGPLHARAGAGIGINRRGLHSEVGAGGNFFNLVNGDADFAARVGRDIGVDGDVRGKVVAVDAQGRAGASVGADGVSAYTGGNTDLAHVAGFRTGGRFALNRYDSGVAAGHTLDIGPSIDSYGNRTLAPRVHVETGVEENAPFYPTGDRDLDEQ